MSCLIGPETIADELVPTRYPANRARVPAKCVCRMSREELQGRPDRDTEVNGESTVHLATQHRESSLSLSLNLSRKGRDSTNASTIRPPGSTNIASVRLIPKPPIRDPRIAIRRAPLFARRRGRRRRQFQRCLPKWEMGSLLPLRFPVLSRARAASLCSLATVSFLGRSIQVKCNRLRGRVPFGTSATTKNGGQRNTVCGVERNTYSKSRVTDFGSSTSSPKK